MRLVVVVVVAAFGLSACPPARRPPDPDCLTYVACYLPEEGSDEGYAKLAAASTDPLLAEDLGCYAGYLGKDGEGNVGNGDDIELLLAPMRRAYSAEGSCWADGYSAVSPEQTDQGLADKAEAACSAVCRNELLAECHRKRKTNDALLACPGNTDVDTFCEKAEAEATTDVDDARCPGAEGEGEGEGE